MRCRAPRQSSKATDAAKAATDERETLDVQRVGDRQHVVRISCAGDLRGIGIGLLGAVAAQLDCRTERVVSEVRELIIPNSGRRSDAVYEKQRRSATPRLVARPGESRPGDHAALRLRATKARTYSNGCAFKTSALVNPARRA